MAVRLLGLLFMFSMGIVRNHYGMLRANSVLNLTFVMTLTHKKPFSIFLRLAL